MKRLALIPIVIGGSLVFAAPAPASWRSIVRGDIVRGDSPYLTMSQARYALIRYGHRDHPRTVTLAGCVRLNDRAVRCSVNETGVLLSFTANGRPLVGSIEWPVVAILRDGRVATRY